MTNLQRNLEKLKHDHAKLRLGRLTFIRGTVTAGPQVNIEYMRLVPVAPQKPGCGGSQSESPSETGVSA